MKGYWMLVLHSHLPFVKHPEYSYFLEEHWLFEAITETYLPLLMNLNRLYDEKIDFKLTMSITPSLSEMLADDYLMGKYRAFLDNTIGLTEKEISRTRNNLQENRLARFYNERLNKIKTFFYGFLDGSVLNGYRYFAKTKNIEIITCAATHGFLPLLSVNKKAVEVQIDTAVKTHEKHFGVRPAGIWLPECAYYKGLDKILDKYNIQFFFLDSHGIAFGRPAPKYGVFAPIYTPSGVAAFGRDPESSKQVWSSKEGYPGDYAYRDFYRDIGYDLDLEYVRPYINPDGMRVFTGIKYYKITGDTHKKELYNPDTAREKTKEHALNFHFNRVKQLEHLNSLMDRPPMIVSPYDSELFGHWWFEGVDFLYHLFKAMDAHKQIKPITPIEYLKDFPSNQVVEPSPSSWGDRGYYDVWLNSGNDWIYRHLHHMADEMQNLAEDYISESDPLKIRVLDQMMRELLLAQSSDWAFLMTTQTAKEYSIRRTKEHISNFIKLENILKTDKRDEEFLRSLETRNSIFGNIDFRIYA